MANAAKCVLWAIMFLVASSTSAQTSYKKVRSTAEDSESRANTVISEINRLVAAKYGISYDEQNEELVDDSDSGDLRLTLDQAEIVLDRLSSELGIPAIHGEDVPSDDSYGFKRTVKKWNMPIRYAFQDRMYTNSEKNIIRQGLKMWSDTTCVRFQEATLSSLGRFDHIVITRGKGCWSYLGRLGGKQQMSLGNGCVSAGTVAHEMGHALGLVHEQNRSDRDRYVKVYLNNVEQSQRHNFNPEPDDLNFSEVYNYFSIMHYPANAFAKNPKLPTMTRINGGTSMGGTRLSKSDISRVNQHYCRTAPPIGPIKPTGNVIAWKGHWAYGCDFKGNDLKRVKVRPELCGPACDKNPPCSHFTWTNWQGGTCFLKSGSVRKCSAFATPNKSFVCGVRPALNTNC